MYQQQQFYLDNISRKLKCNIHQFRSYESIHSHDYAFIAFKINFLPKNVTFRSYQCFSNNKFIQNLLHFAPSQFWSVYFQIIPFNNCDCCGPFFSYFIVKKSHKSIENIETTDILPHRHKMLCFHMVTDHGTLLSLRWAELNWVESSSLAFLCCFKHTLYIYLFRQFFLDHR